MVDFLCSAVSQEFAFFFFFFKVFCWEKLLEKIMFQYFAVCFWVVSLFRTFLFALFFCAVTNILLVGFLITWLLVSRESAEN